MLWCWIFWPVWCGHSQYHHYWSVRLVGFRLQEEINAVVGHDVREIIFVVIMTVSFKYSVTV